MVVNATAPENKRSPRSSPQNGGNPQVTSRLSFPLKLYEMLEDAEEQGFNDIVSWNSAGDGFKVHDTTTFVKKIIPSYYNCTKYKSFQRQLSLYGFLRETTGARKGIRSHKNFLRGHKDMCRQMKPLPSANGSKSAIGSKSLPQDHNSISSSSSSSSLQSPSITEPPASNFSQWSSSLLALPPPTFLPNADDSSLCITAPNRRPGNPVAVESYVVEDPTMIVSDDGYSEISRPQMDSSTIIRTVVNSSKSEEGDVGFFEGMPFFLTERKDISAANIIPVTSSTSASRTARRGDVGLGPPPVLFPATYSVESTAPVQQAPAYVRSVLGENLTGTNNGLSLSFNDAQQDNCFSAQTFMTGATATASV